MMHINEHDLRRYLLLAAASLFASGCAAGWLFFHFF